MAPSNGKPYSPVQMQKLLFLLDREAGLSDGPFFDFQPYSYGPFDKAVYEVLEDLAASSLVTINHDGVTRIYSLTPAGQSAANGILKKIQSLPVRRYFRSVSKFVHEHSFTQLISAIYKAYPEMKVNSVFRRVSTT